ncbi:MAG: AbrB/MazE/SpoVT family DNA-binding domain-containing protein [Clostridia bacterium]|nr:AbrB/MazE/SpoVT family DNA-binding domain-containing protein [Clostridia bacterium]
MKKDYSIRTIDSVGRIVIPMDLRKMLDIQEWDELRIFRDHDRIIVEKNNPTCAFCHSAKDLISFKEKYICKKCLDEAKG